MLSKIKGLAPQSKKFWFAFLAIGIVALVMDIERAKLVAQIAGFYLVGQGMADFGKEKSFK